MANIFPPEEADWGSKEAKVARFLNEYLDDDFYLFLNFKYLDNVKGVSREGDVLVLCNEGFLVIEIKENLRFYERRFLKDCECRRDKTCRDCNGKGVKTVQPVKQAEDSLQGFLNQISSDVGLNINKVHKNTGVITWGKKVNLDNLTSFDVSESRGFVRSLGDLEVKSKNLGPTLKQYIYGGDGGDRSFSKKEFETIVEFCSGRVEKRSYEDEITRLSQVDDEKKKVFYERYIKTDIFGEDSYQIIEGTSGSGKTTLAKQVAEHHSRAGRSVCIIYRNLGIATEVRNEFKQKELDIEVFTIHPFIFEELRANELKITSNNLLSKFTKKFKNSRTVLDVLENLKENEQNLYNPLPGSFDMFEFTEKEFYRSICFDALDELNGAQLIEEFDTIILDEAQTFSSDQVSSISNMLSDRKPSLFLFADTFQFLDFGFEETYEPPKEINGRRVNKQAPLLENYRTSNVVTNFMNVMAGTKLEMNEVEGRLYGPVKAKGNQWLEKIEEAVTILREGFEDNEIVVLSPEREFIAQKFEELKQTKLFGINFILDLYDKSYVDQEEILFSSVRRFTGRQSKAVILLLPNKRELEKDIFENYEELAFIGAGRTQHSLYIIHSPGIDKELNFHLLDS